MSFRENNRDLNDSSALEAEAAKWHVRDQQGLSEEERFLFERRCLEEPELLTLMGEYDKTRQLVEDFPGDMISDLLESCDEGAFRRKKWVSALLPLAALFIFAFTILGFYGVFEDHPTTRVLEDGSYVRLNSGAKIEVNYTEKSRNIKLSKGEAFFTVQKDANRPFAVWVDNVCVRAVGTAFNVSKEIENVGVIVTEGVVKVYSGPEQVTENLSFDEVVDKDFFNEHEFVSEGQRADIAVLTANTDVSSIHVFDSVYTEVTDQLQWRESLLTISGESLKDIAANFEEKTGYKLIIVDPALKNRQIGGRFPSEDVYGFMSILKNGYGIDWEEILPGVIEIGNR